MGGLGMKHNDRDHSLRIFDNSRELVAKQDIWRWRAIIIVSGDGLLHEVYNGLFDREDWLVSCQIPIGVIPAGSGNGLACSIAWQSGGSFSKKMMVRQVRKKYGLDCFWPFFEVFWNILRTFQDFLQPENSLKTI